MNTINDIQFYDNRNDCISQFEKSSLITKALSSIRSYGEIILYGLNKFSLILNRAVMKPEYINPHSKDMADKLVVCIHGLNNSPLQFKSLVNELEKSDLSDTSIYTPSVIARGNGELDEMVKPIFKKIKHWSKKEGEKELVLVGISNGGRIARAIEVELAKAGYQNIKKVRFVSIVGACKGSSLADLANRCHLPVLSKNIAKEMPMGSERFKKLNTEWEENVNSRQDIDRDYSFIAAPHDWQVPDYESTLMEVKHKARYAIVRNHGHNSVVDAAAKSVSQIIST